MAKKSKKQAKPIPNAFEKKRLPQNIRPFGERVEENKNIYISQPTYQQIHKFTQNKTTNESGGMLIGYITEEFGKTNIVICGFIEAKFCDATPTTLKFTHETWEYVHKEMDRQFPGGKIVGWIHTHPDFGIFLSEYDKFIHENFFKEDYQIAYVVDPIQKIEGFYFWINGKIERCKGFYVFDKTGVEITVSEDSEEPPAERRGVPAESHSFLRTAAMIVMAVAILVLLLMNISQSSRIQDLEDNQQALMDTANVNLTYIQQQFGVLEDRISFLEQERSSTAEGDTEPTEPETQPTEPTAPAESESATETSGAASSETASAETETAP